MPIKVTSTREIRPLRWFAGFAVACLVAYLAGTNANADAPAGTASPTIAACTTR
jgi:hypothetical protein